MAKINKTLSTLIDEAGKSEILLRFVGGRNFIFRAKSGIHIPANRWKDDKIIMPRLETPEQKELLKAQKKLDSLCSLILESFVETDKSIVNKEWLELLIDKFHNPSKYQVVKIIPFFDAFDNFLAKHRLSVSRVRHFRVLQRDLRRFEMYANTTLALNTLKADTIREIENFIRDEYLICEDKKYKHIYQMLPEAKTIPQRGQNTINGKLTKLRTFILWSIREGYTENNPFRQFSIKESVYGTPYYITIDERDRIFNTNLTNHPHLAIQRDIFVFQCLIGCRVGDLLKLEQSNIINGAIEYVPRKTRDGNPVRVRVPLSKTAREILDRYSDRTSNGLLPFISEQKYNDSIKKIFRAARLYRWVTIINPTTREEEKQRLYNIASSHLARRTFIGNLYKKVKDPNLVGALSGHKEGSKAFARYRDIDEDIRTELVGLLEN